MPDSPSWTNPDPKCEAEQMLRFAHKIYAPRKTWCLCSGGNDSLTSTHIAMASGLCDGVVSIDTTIGIEDTRRHMRIAAEKFNWPLRWLTPTTTYYQFCQRFGMPGPGFHAYAYNVLKERCLRQLLRESKRLRKDKILLITGVRASESDRRMGHAAPIFRHRASVWVAPIIHWDASAQLAYMLSHAIPRNPVKTVLGISGECLCGAFAKPNELNKIKQYYPAAAAEIARCEAAAAAAKRPHHWGERPTALQQLCQQCTRKNGVSDTDSRT